MASDEPRLTGTSYAVLGLVRYLGEATPYDLKRLLEQSVENFWPVPHTTSYAEPARLAAAGYLSERREERGRRRRLYTLTDAGRAALDAWVAEPTAAAPQLRDEGMLKLFLGADPAPLIRERARWHRDKLAELEGYLERVRSIEGLAGMERSLLAGTRYHRLLAEGYEGALAELG